MSNQAQVLLAQDKLSSSRTNHLLHFFLSIFTLGFWVPVWLLISISNWLERSQAKREIKKAVA